jgi:hypothetical protein
MGVLPEIAEGLKQVFSLQISHASYFVIERNEVNRFPSRRKGLHNFENLLVVGMEKILFRQSVQGLSCLSVMGDNRAESDSFQHVIVLGRL